MIGVKVGMNKISYYFIHKIRRLFGKKSKTREKIMMEASVQLKDNIRPTTYIIPKEWEQQGDRLYALDTVIDAYLKGKQEGLNEFIRSQGTQLRSNLNKALEYAEGVFEELRDALKIQVLGMRARACGIFEIEILFIVNNEDFVSEKMETAYNYLQKKHEEINKDLNWSYLVMPSLGENLNEEAIQSDGFAFRYAPKEGN
jgi:hypothetical protein